MTINVNQAIGKITLIEDIGRTVERICDNEKVEHSDIEKLDLALELLEEYGALLKAAMVQL